MALRISRQNRMIYVLPPEVKELYLTVQVLRRRIDGIEERPLLRHMVGTGMCGQDALRRRSRMAERAISLYPRQAFSRVGMCLGKGRRIQHNHIIGCSLSDLLTEVIKGILNRTA